MNWPMVVDSDVKTKRKLSEAFVNLLVQHHMSHFTRKPVFGVCDQRRLKSASSATGTS